MSLEAYRAEVASYIRETPAEIGRDFTNLREVYVDLPPGEEPYWTVPRVRGEWRLSGDTGNGGEKSDELTLLPMRHDWYNENAYLSTIPQPMIMHRLLGEVIENEAWRLFGHYPEERGPEFPGGGSLAQRLYQVPMLLGRIDGICKKNRLVQFCENDDAPSLWPALSEINPIANSYLEELEDQLGYPIYTAELFHYKGGRHRASPPISLEGQTHILQQVQKALAQNPDYRTRKLWLKLREDVLGRTVGQQLLSTFYAHNEDHMRGDFNDILMREGRELSLNEVALVVRAYRELPGFKAHMNRYGPRSITMAWERDTKFPLVPRRLGVLANNLETAVDFGKDYLSSRRGEYLVFKTLHGAGTRGTAIYSHRSTRPKGVSRGKDIHNKFGAKAGEPIIIQPFTEPDNLEEAGVTFIGTADEIGYTDRNAIRSVSHIGTKRPGERVLEGEESHFSLAFRSIVAYLPREKRLKHLGGMWQATDGRIVHGGSHSVSGPLYVDGLGAHPAAYRNKDIEEAEKLLAKYGRAS